MKGEWGMYTAKLFLEGFGYIGDAAG